MARKTTTFKIEGRDGEVELKELRVNEIINLFQSDYDTTISGFKSLISKFLPLCSNLSQSDLYSMTPSELEIVWSKFKEVNSVFLKVSQQIGVEKLLGDMKLMFIETVTKDFSKLLVNFSKRDMLMH